MTVTRAHLVESISRQVDLPKGQCTQLLGSLLELLMKTLESGEDVLISGFGKFCIWEKKKRKGRNPATGREHMLNDDGW
jgi:integration host factor subunit alpha